MSAGTQGRPKPAPAIKTEVAAAAEQMSPPPSGRGTGGGHMMRHTSYPMFDLIKANVPNDLSPVATEMSPMLPGDWRSMRPVVNRDKCVKCAVCWLYCPVQCVEEHAAWFDFNLKTCKGCGICANECPQRAITMIPEAT